MKFKFKPGDIIISKSPDDYDRRFTYEISAAFVDPAGFGVYKFKSTGDQFYDPKRIEFYYELSPIFVGKTNADS